MSGCCKRRALPDGRVSAAAVASMPPQDALPAPARMALWMAWARTGRASGRSRPAAVHAKLAMLGSSLTHRCNMQQRQVHVRAYITSQALT